MRMKHLLASALAFTMLATAPSAVQAAEDVVLVELFTSQGCSSCPPADRNLGDLTRVEGVLPLSMHVDYWDYLGWKDTFADRKHTQRQFAYRDFLGARVVYTPQMIIQGAHDVPGYKPDLIAKTIQTVQESERAARIAIRSESGMLKAELTPVGKPSRCTVWVATFEKKATVAIDRGENAGRSITYHNVVQNLMKVGPWSGNEVTEIDLPQPSQREGVAIWIQDDRTGRILSVSFVEG